MYQNHMEIAEKELEIGNGQASDLERIVNIKTRQSELADIKKDINEALDSIKKGMEHIIQLKDAEEQIIESNLDLIKMLENHIENEGVKVPE